MSPHKRVSHRRCRVTTASPSNLAGTQTGGGLASRNQETAPPSRREEAARGHGWTDGWCSFVPLRRKGGRSAAHRQPFDAAACCSLFFLLVFFPLTCALPLMTSSHSEGQPSENIIVRNLTCSTSSNAICVGSEMSGAVRRVFVDGYTNTRAGNVIGFKSNKDRGVSVP